MLAPFSARSLSLVPCSLLQTTHGNVYYVGYGHDFDYDLETTHLALPQICIDRVM